MASEFRLSVGYDPLRDRSYRASAYFTAPIKLGEPRTEGNRLQLMLMMASAGILASDSFSYDIRCQAGSRALITEQSYTKLFDMGDAGLATREMSVALEAGASLWYRPCAVVPFRNSDFRGKTEIRMEKGSELLWTDIFTAGRVGMGERFLFRRYENLLRVWYEDQLIWHDRTLLKPAELAMENRYFYRDYTHQGSCFYCGSEAAEARILAMNFSDPRYSRIYAGASQAARGVCVRVLAKQAQDIEELFSEIQRQI